jgi:hypothetical protein
MFCEKFDKNKLTDIASTYMNKIGLVISPTWFISIMTLLIHIYI